MTTQLLDHLVRASARAVPDAVAVTALQSTVTYRELDRRADQVANALLACGVRPKDRVGLWLEKCVESVSAMQGTLRIGAAYVPLDPLSPVRRAHTILADCSVRAVVTTRGFADALIADGMTHVTFVTIDGPAVPGGITWDEVRRAPEAAPEISGRSRDDLAYVLYTSGSTGTPKGVCLSHGNALAFVDWAVETLAAVSSDRFANHAPFHFDLSVLDLYAAFAVGASVALISEAAAYSARDLVDFVTRERPTIWYSVPSALVLMIERAEFLELPDVSIRALLFAGEPFPMRPLRSIQKRWPSVRLLNLYGPTETNVCTWYEVSEDLDTRTRPIPIGKASCGDKVWAVGADGETLVAGGEGELLVTGPTVMLGYWGRPPQRDAPYATGDVVRLEADGNFVYIGRRDHMVKVRGHRVELGEIEAALREHPRVRDVVVITHGAGLEARLVAFLVVDGEGLSPLEVRRHCADRVPRYMIVDKVRCVNELPRTSTGKVDRLALVQRFGADQEGAR